MILALAEKEVKKKMKFEEEPDEVEDTEEEEW